MAGFFVLAERPVQSAICPDCSIAVKTAQADAYQSLTWFLIPDYKTSEIKVLEGKSYEKISSKFLHTCPKLIAQSAADSIGSV